MEKHILFLDTSFFESENFFKGRNLNHLCELSRSGQIEIKITDIIYREVQHRIKENVLKAQSAFKKAHALITGEGKILKNLENYEIPKVDAEEVIKELTERFDRFIIHNQIEIIDSEISNINEVFKDYFETNPPFHEGKKKTEFPDAFTYSTVKAWSTQKVKKVYFLSNDSDFENLSSDEIDCSQSLSTIIDLIAREIDEKHTKIIEETYEDSKFEIERSLVNDYKSDLAEAVYNQLENDPFYEDVEVETADDIAVEIVIGVINEVIIDSSFSYEIESNITFSIRVEFTDLTSGFYDKEDGVWWGQERISETKQYSANVISIAEFSYDLEKGNGFYYMTSNFSIRDIEEL